MSAATRPIRPVRVQAEPVDEDDDGYEAPDAVGTREGGAPIAETLRPAAEAPEPRRDEAATPVRTRTRPPPAPVNGTYYPNLAPDDRADLRQARKDLIRRGYLKHQTDDLAGMLKALNFTANDKGIGTELFKLVRRDLRLIQERQMIALDHAAYKLACAVFSRGLGWGKYSERITYEQFEKGLCRDGEWVDHGSMDLEWLPAFAGTTIPRRTLERRVPELHRAGVLTRYRIAHARGYDFHYLYGTPGILKQLLLRHIEKNGRDQKSVGKRLTEARQAKEDLILELVDGLIRLDGRNLPPNSPEAPGGWLERLIEAERVQAAKSHGQL